MTRLLAEDVAERLEWKTASVWAALSKARKERDETGEDRFGILPEPEARRNPDGRYVWVAWKIDRFMANRDGRGKGGGGYQRSSGAARGSTPPATPARPRRR